MRVNQPSGWFYTSDALRTLCDIWERHGSGLTNMHGSTGDIIFLGTKTDELEPIFKELTEAGFDLGGSGSCMRTPSCCVGQARCEWACYDTMAICDDLTQHYQDELHRPPFPYKFKIKCSGCPNDCVASIARADLSIIGTWKDDIQQDDAAVAEYAAAGLDIQKDVCDRCPTKCMEWDGKKLTIDNRECVRCMHCINVMPKALRPGKETGATHPDRRQGAHRPGRAALLGARALRAGRRAAGDAEGADRAHLGVLGRARQEPRARRRADPARRAWRTSSTPSGWIRRPR